MAEPTPAPAPEPKLVELKGPDGQSLHVLESQRLDYLARGYDDASTLPEPEMSGGEAALARGEAFGRGATLGLSGPASDLGVGVASELSGYQGPRVSAPGLEAPVDDTSNLRLGMEQAALARQQRAEGLGAEGLAWEAAGGIGASLATGGSSMAAKALAMGPAGLAERAGTAVAAKILGKQLAEEAVEAGARTAAQTIVPGIGRIVAARAAGGATEAAIAAGLGTASESVSLALDNPMEAAKDVALGTVGGAVLGGALGGAFGLVEGASRAVGRQLDAITEATRPREAVPAVRDLTPEMAVAEGAARPMHAAELPTPQRSFARTLSDLHHAASGGADDAVQQGTRSVRAGLDELQGIRDELDIEAGVAAKAVLNRADIRQRLANEVTDIVDEADAVKLTDLTTRATSTAQAAKSAEGNLTAAQATLKASQEAETTARQALDLAETSKAAKPEIRGLREALKNAQRESKEAAKRVAKLEADFHPARQAAEAADAEMRGGFVPRKLTKVEVESRGMFNGLMSGIDDLASKVAGKDYDAVMQLRKQAVAHRDLAYRMMRAGDYATAYEVMDRGLKTSMKDFANSTRSTVAETFAKEAYNIPRSFLENRDVWGEVAERQLAANPNWSTAIAAGEDAHWRSLFGDVGEKNVDGWGVRKGAKSEGVYSMLNAVGESGKESIEEGVRRKLRADTVDFASRSAAWGTPRARELAARAAKIAAHVEDTMDSTALIRRDAASADQAMKGLTSLLTLGAVTGAVFGEERIGIPFVAARWLVSAVSRYKVDRLQKIGSWSAKMARAGAKRGEAVGRLSVRNVALRISEKEREAAIQRANEMTDLRSPMLAARAREAEATNAMAPGLGDALLQREVAEAEYIKSKLPQSPSPALFSPEGRLSGAAARQLDRVLAATRNPTKTFERIADGAATPEDLDAMRRIYPEQYSELVQTTLDELEKTKRRPRSAAQKMYLSRVTGMALTPALMRLSESQRRAQAATAGAEEAGAPQGEGANGSDGVTPRAKMSIEPEDVYGSRADQIMTR